MNYPGALGEAVTQWLATHHEGPARAASTSLSATYREGGNSSAVDLATYLIARTPATYAAVSKAFAMTAEAMSGFAPASCLDIGCGPGTASWAAIDTWPDIANFAMRDKHPAFLDIAGNLASNSGIASLASAEIARADIMSDGLPKSDLVIASYVLAELPEDRAAQAALNLWRVTNQTLIIIDPGTPRGYARINSIRNALLRDGANIAAPCTHANACPMTADDWCHFSTRLARSRAHMHAKSGILPYEDEPFAFIAATRLAPNLARARILAPPEETKFNRSFKTCSAKGLADEAVATRDKPAFKRVRKLKWGDVL
jgi:ribosomal protein RSM22 (predicted rRNA methylase)